MSTWFILFLIVVVALEIYWLRESEKKFHLRNDEFFLTRLDPIQRNVLETTRDCDHRWNLKD